MIFVVRGGKKHRGKWKPTNDVLIGLSKFFFFLNQAKEKTQTINHKTSDKLPACFGLNRDHRATK